MRRMLTGIAIAGLAIISIALTSGPTQAASVADRTKGYILLQVQAHGEAWFVRGKDGMRYYMKDGGVAYGMMRSFGLGITDSDLTAIPPVATVDELKSASSVCSTNALAKRLSGEILLQVQQHGEAWYVYPTNCRRIYLKDGQAAYDIMRYVGLGISDADLTTIPTSEDAGNGQRVSRVIDGDTVELTVNGVLEKVRLIGINAPETGDCFGSEATAKLTELLANTTITLTADATQTDRDKYNRLLRYLITPTGVNLNEEMVRLGYAREYTYDKPYQYQAAFRADQTDAQTRQIGLWAPDACSMTTLPPAPSTPGTPTAYDCSANIYNCDSFQTHQEAQQAFDYCLAQTGKDIHQLDADHNGLACESLP